jgi:Ser/Thr protein kinase RdoA (MazF antagonist)
MNDQNKVKILLKRTSLNISFDNFLKIIKLQFSSLGKILSYKPINEGYEDANFLLNTSNGKFILKIFLEERSFKNIRNYIRVLNECKKVGVQTTEILTDSNNGLGCLDNRDKKTYFIITKFFEGTDFKNIVPTLEDIKSVTEYIARLNTLNFNVSETYDSWGNKNLAKEYMENKDKVTFDQKSFIEPIYNEFVNLDYSSFSKSVIHGDMQRKHVLKNIKGEYCILDFGCMAYDPKVIDLSTYLAWFCLQNDTWKDRDTIYSMVLDIYNKKHNLIKAEIDSLPILIKSSYAAYYLKTSILINEGDKSKETFDWHNKSKTMLILSKKWK